MRAAIGVDELYTHQRAAWDAAARGEHVVVTTGTASGKTLAFNLPVLDALARDPRSRALYLYPTKALAQDQFRALGTYRVPRLRPAIYDGDTPTEQRRQIRSSSNLVLTNPDMVHIGLLPNHERWGERAREPALRRSSTRRTCIAASSGRTSRTSCGGCGGSRGSTAPSPSSCSPRRPSPTPASSAGACSERTSP